MKEYKMTGEEIESEWNFIQNELNNIGDEPFPSPKRELYFMMQLLLSKISNDCGGENLNQLLYRKTKEFYYNSYCYQK